MVREAAKPSGSGLDGQNLEAAAQFTETLLSYMHTLGSVERVHKASDGVDSLPVVTPLCPYLGLEQGTL